MWCPFAVQKPITANFGGVMGDVFGLVVHVQEGNNSLQGWFSNPAAGASSHFWVSKAGALEQYINTDSRSWAQGAGNGNYLSVETEGYDTEPLNGNQISMLARLFTWVHDEYGTPYVLVNHGYPGFTTHSFYPSGLPDPAWSNHPCPGNIRLNQLPAVIASVTQPTPEPEDEDMKWIFATEGQPTWVQSGNLVWQISDNTPYAAAGFQVLRVSVADNGKLAAIAKAQGSVG